METVRRWQDWVSQTVDSLPPVIRKGLRRFEPFSKFLAATIAPSLAFINLVFQSPTNWKISVNALMGIMSVCCVLYELFFGFEEKAKERAREKSRDLREYKHNLFTAFKDFKSEKIDCPVLKQRHKELVSSKGAGVEDYRKLWDDVYDFQVERLHG